MISIQCYKCRKKLPAMEWSSIVYRDPSTTNFENLFSGSVTMNAIYTACIEECTLLCGDCHKDYRGVVNEAKRNAVKFAVNEFFSEVD